MKRVGLTQRSQDVPGLGERRDMLDQRWCALIDRLGACPIPLPNNVRNIDAYLEALALDTLVLTGGNDIGVLPGASDRAPERDHFESVAYRHALRRGNPVLGVCRGAQMINHLNGGRLIRVDHHIGARHDLFWADALPPYWDKPVEVNSYHGWAIPTDGLAPGMEALAWCEDGTVEAFRATSASVSAVIWHPERERELSDSALTFLAAALGL
jgi:gamma-glutamyl-gamma-aminobutyrate hydrolase PuuD